MTSRQYPFGPLRVVCAAARHCKTGEILCAPRHSDHIMRPLMDKLGWPNDAEIVEFGFVDQDGHFLSREEALSLAKERGQVPADDHGTILSSEDLY